MFSYILVVSAGYILLISICPMLKAGKLHSLASSAILANLFKTEAVAGRCSVKKGVLRNFAKRTGKHLCQSLFLNKVLLNFIKKETLTQVFSGEFYKISLNTFSYRAPHVAASI